MISQMTAAGFRPARRARSTSLRSAPRAPARRRRGAQRVDVPGPEQVLRLRVLGDGDFDRLGAVAALTPVVTPKRGCASTVTVNAVPSWRV
jgi:hypothetical protein